MHRIIEVVPSVFIEASGLAQAVKRMSESVIDLNQQKLTLASLDFGGKAFSLSYLNTFPVGIGPKKLGRSPSMLRWLNKKAENGNVDLVHSHGLWMQPNVYPSFVCKKHRLPLVISPHGTLSPWAFSSGSFLKKIYWPLLQKPALSAATCFHATAISEYQDIRNMGFRQPVAVLPNGIDLPKMQPHTIDKNKRTILFLGRIHQVKGLDLLLMAWSAIQKRFPDWHLRIVGPDDGGYLMKMQDLSNQLGLQRIEFSGALFGEEKLQAYQQADLFVLPTYSENFGISVAESLAAGTPAIVAKGAPWEGLEYHHAGKWIDIGLDPLVAALEKMLSLSREELDAMGARGRSWMEAEFSWSKIGVKMAETYQWIINGGKKPDWVIMN
jgi:glycosyltransferase involved in cell wall biosynthesis